MGMFSYCKTKMKYQLCQDTIKSLNFRHSLRGICDSKGSVWNLVSAHSIDWTNVEKFPVKANFSFKKCRLERTPVLENRHSGWNLTAPFGWYWYLVINSLALPFTTLSGIENQPFRSAHKSALGRNICNRLPMCILYNNTTYTTYNSFR